MKEETGIKKEGRRGGKGHIQHGKEGREEEKGMVSSEELRRTMDGELDGKK